MFNIDRSKAQKVDPNLVACLEILASGDIDAAVETALEHLDTVDAPFCIKALLGTTITNSSPKELQNSLKGLVFSWATNHDQLPFVVGTEIWEKLF